MIPKALCFGAVLWDIEGSKKNLGGALLNVAANFKKLDVDAYLYTCIGTDENGIQALEEIEDTGIHKNYIKQSSIYSTGYAKIKFDKNKIPQYKFLEEASHKYISVTDRDIKRINATAFDVICYGTFCQQGIESRNSLYKLLREANFSLHFCDINIRHDNIDLEIIYNSLKYADILKINDEEYLKLLKWLYNQEMDENDFVQKLRNDYNIKIICITKGGKGCTIYGEEQIINVPGKRIIPVDTVGAGDAFSAGFIAAYLNGYPLEICGEAGNELGAFVAMHHGAIVNYNKDLYRRLPIRKGERMSNEKWIEETLEMADNIRKRVLGLTIEQGGCYLTQALSSAEILATLYNKIMNLGKSEGDRVPGVLDSNPIHSPYEITGGVYHGAKEGSTDRFLISPAHYAVAVYAALVEKDRLDADLGLRNFNKDGSKVSMIGEESSPGFELTTGSFGQCISQAGGIATARKLKGDTGKVYVFLSDGELQEGQTWEAVQCMSFYQIDNVIIYVDVNGQQVDGYTKDVMNIEPLNSRFEAFGAKVVTVNGHDVEALYEASLKGEKGKPLVVLCYTDPCRGVPLLERRKPKLHYVRIPEAEMAEFKEVYKSM